MDFSDALKAAKDGKTIYRIGWNNDTIRVGVQRVDAGSRMTKPYLYMEKLTPPEKEGQDSPSEIFPLDLSCESIFAEDWEIRE